jgi:hypothetical protein
MRTRVVVCILTLLCSLAAAGTSSADAEWAVQLTVVSGPVPGLPNTCTGVTSEGETFLASEPGRSGHLVAVWSAGAGNGANTSVTAVSSDGGETWARAAVPGTGPCTKGPGDWVIDQWVSIGGDGRAYYESFAGHNPGPSATPFDAQTIVSASPSGGDMWPSASVIDDNLQGARGLISRTSITADPAAAGRAWAVWARFVNPIFQGIFVARTDDGGTTWGPAVRAADVPAGAAGSWQMVVRPDGGLVLFYGELDTLATAQVGFFGQPGPALARAVVSTDGGATWSGPADVASMRAYMLARAASAPDGNLYFVWNETLDGTADVLVSDSSDGGQTWSSPDTVDTFPAGPLGHGHVAPDIAVSDNGDIGVSYYDARPGDGRIARRFAHSTDAGATWVSQQLGEPFDYDTGTGGTGDGPQGAYQGIAPVGDGFGALFIAGTGDPADPTDVVFARIAPGV